MSISDLHPQPSPAAVLADVVAMVRDLDATWWTNQSDDDLVATVVSWSSRPRSALAAVEAGAVAEADARDLGKARSFTTGRPVTGSPTSAGSARARAAGSWPVPTR